MSIRTNPMKAIPLMLTRLRRIGSTMQLDKPCVEKLKMLTSQLEQIEDLFKIVKKNGNEFLDALSLLDGHLRKLHENKGDKDKLEPNILNDISKKIEEATKKLLPKGADNQGQTQPSTTKKVKFMDQKIQKEPSDPSLSQLKNKLLAQDLNKAPKVSYKELKDNLKPCVFSLNVFPEGAVIRKRHTVYWWIGEGFVKSEGEKTAEEVGEGVIDELLKFKVIFDYGNGSNPVAKKFVINPHIHYELKSLGPREKHQLGSSLVLPSNVKQHDLHSQWLVLEKKKITLGSNKDNLKPEDLTTIFNLRVSYLNFVSQWSAKMRKLAVLQLGRWQDSPLQHIEVGSEEFLKELKDQKHLKYLSLRGISRIPELPPSIAQLSRLEILDLKACHNLETLPTDIASMKSLTHLDVSECYLLDSMPRGIEKLTQLQVLKGFVIGNSRKTPCRITDLANLKKLKRLSIHIGSEAVIQPKEFESLKELTAVKCLKISWGVFDKYSDIQVIFPPSLEKLDLEGFPGITIPEWLKPSRIPAAMKKLYIKGGKLKSLDHSEICHKWHVEILRLKYLNWLQLEERKLLKLFPSVKYVERTMVLNRSYPEWKFEE
ncbi:hypothetical protein VNO78_27566 [Psophocarpus tetragonolobus]|uniref:Disease resistance RPP13-like protein 4 n=1 Tax=Psophocarpus tetragonolobus TaxID=3891 RepID=A0AAN9S1S8_PSOTE